MIKSLVGRTPVVIDGFVISKVSAFYNMLDSRQILDLPFAFG